MPKNGPRRSYSTNNLGGCVQQRKCRATKMLVGIYSSYEAGMESDPELPWSVVCETHGAIVCTETLYAAQRTATDTTNFCDECRDIQERT